MGCQCAKKDENPEKEITKPPGEEKEKDVPESNDLEGFKNIQNVQSVPLSVPPDSQGQRNAEDPINNQSLSKISGTGSRVTKKVDYNKDVIELINKIRADPKSFVEDIEKAIEKIKDTEIKGEKKKIYEGKVKVSVKEGEAAFRAAADLLREMNPMGPLEFDEELAIEVPNDEAVVKNPKTFQELMKQKKEIVSVEGFKDSVKDPYTGVLLMVIDDAGKNSGKKRNLILGPDFRKIAITSRKINKTFAAYLTFAK